MQAVAVVLDRPGQLRLSRLDLLEASDADIAVEIEWSGISTGTERLFWTGRMPHFPGMGYPLVPGYESVGVVRQAGAQSGHRAGQRVFVPGARCFKHVKGLFGGAASRLIVPGNRAVTVDDDLGENAVLLALAATAHHALAGHALPDLIVGHGTLGRLLARLCLVLAAHRPVVWESRNDRRSGAIGYDILDPSDDPRRDYRTICDVSGDASQLDALIGRLASGGEIVLAGFYSEPLQFSFPPAFMREARLRVAAEWRESDLVAVRDLVRAGKLSLDGLITHRRQAEEARDAYGTAFDDSSCLKMILDWRSLS